MKLLTIEEETGPRNIYEFKTLTGEIEVERRRKVCFSVITGTDVYTLTVGNTLILVSTSHTYDVVTTVYAENTNWRVRWAVHNVRLAQTQSMFLA